jgi:hypothetical protein
MIRSIVACIVFAAITMIGLAPIGFAQAQGYLFNQYGGPGSYNSWDNFALAQGDFNQDGRLDFAVADRRVEWPTLRTSRVGDSLLTGPHDENFEDADLFPARRQIVGKLSGRLLDPLRVGHG